MIPFGGRKLGWESLQFINQRMKILFHIKHFKTLRHVSIVSDHHQGALFLVRLILQYSQLTIRWEYNIKKYRYEIVYQDVSWIQTVQDRKHLISAVNTLSIHKRCLTSCKNTRLSISTPYLKVAVQSAATHCTIAHQSAPQFTT